MALGHVDDGVVTAGIFAYLSYGTYLNDRKQHAEAIPSLRRGLALSVRNSNTVHRYRIYRELSEAEAALGDYRRALQYYRIFHAEADSIFNVSPSCWAPTAPTSRRRSIAVRERLSAAISTAIASTRRCAVFRTWTTTRACR